MGACLPACWLSRRECYGIVEVFSDRLVINGVDTFASEDWALPPLPQPQPAKQQAAAQPAAGAAQPAGR